MLDSPLPQLDRLFDYAIPDALAADAIPGVRARVPLRAARRIVDAFIVDVDTEDAPDRELSELDSVVSAVPVLSPALYRLARRLADRAAGSVNDILRVAIPRRMVRAEKAWLANREDSAPPATVSESTASWAQSVLADYRGFREHLHEHARVALSVRPAPAASGARGVWADVVAAAAVAAYARGESAVLVVPDHRDLEQLAGALADRVEEEDVVRLDAAQPAPARYRAYLRASEPRPVIVLGNRSSVYAPAHRLGLILVWDDGDPLLAEPHAPGVHARDAALVRQETESCALVFAGHTRTTDVQRLRAMGWLHEVVETPRRTPRVLLTPMREGESMAARIPSAAFSAAREALTSGPVLVQVARPGYAPVLACAGCREPARCRRCGGPLRAARRGAVPECAWCGARADAWRCSTCESSAFRLVGSGSERTAEELGRAFPGTRIIVSDGEHPVTEVDSNPALVIATRGAEPLAVGGFRAVLLLDGERMLMAEDLRIAEHCLRWWSNAAALAAPGAPVHLVGVAGDVGRALATWSQPQFAQRELVDRAALHMPPAVRSARIDGSRREVEDTLAAVRADVSALPTWSVLGPVPDRDGWRAVLRFDYHDGAAITEALRAAVIREASRSRRRQPGADTPARGGSTLRVRLDLLDIDIEGAP
ncbi:primosomal protein N' [Microbacterium sediminicola]|uniref:primosomal protein N' family DNA-binding protein n=1 Tax=Microbacterium sediminicola TaxID=415210 RepID=UPI0031D957E3